MNMNTIYDRIYDYFDYHYQAESFMECSIQNFDTYTKCDRCPVNFGATEYGECKKCEDAAVFRHSYSKDCPDCEHFNMCKEFSEELRKDYEPDVADL